MREGRHHLGVLIRVQLSLGIRRLHDIGKSGWWTLLVLIPLIGAIVLLIFACQPGVRADTKYGPDLETGR